MQMLCLLDCEGTEAQGELAQGRAPEKAWSITMTFLPARASSYAAVYASSVAPRIATSKYFPVALVERA